MSRVRCAAIGALMLAAVHTAGAEDVWVGLRGGLDIPWLSGGGNEVSRGYKSILAATIGAVAEYPLTDHVSLQLEANYSGQGGERKGLQPITQALPGMPPPPPGQYYYGDFKNKSVLYYLEVPLMAKYRWEVADRWHCFVEFGPYVGYLLSAEQQTRGSSQIFVGKNGPALPIGSVSFDANTDVDGDLHKWNLGLTAGVGAAYLINPNNQIFLDIRGEYGLTPVQQDSKNGESNTGCAAVLLGYMYKFGR